MTLKQGIIFYPCFFFVVLEHFPQAIDVQYTGPTLFVGGALSDYIQVSDFDEIRESFPRAEFVYVEDAGHWVHSQKPTEFLEEVLKFV